MESKDEVSDSDSGVILQSGSDSPQSMMKDRCCSVILRKQMLEESLEACLNELKKLCLRESELTGYLPKEYPLAEGEEPPTVRRRVGTAFQLDELTITPKGEDSELDCLERDFALQLQFVEAAKRLSQEGNLSRHIRKQRKHAYKKEQKKLNEIKNTINELKAITGGRTAQTSNGVEELSASDDSSLEDDTRQHHSQCSSTEFLPATHALQRSNLPLPLLQPSRPTPPQTLEGLSPGCYQCSDYEKSPIVDTAWAESNLDEPYEKVKRRSSLNSKSSSPAVTPSESGLSDISPFQHFEMRSSPYQNQTSASAPSTPEMRGRIHHQTGRIVRTPSLKEYPNRSLLRDVVSEELQSWHERARQRNGRPHSLDRQGAFRGPRTQSRSREQYMRWPALPLQRHMPHWVRDRAQNQWYMTEESEVASQF
ncbi:innate immunity activator protein-like isoform X3 [Pristis pectinata]|uniref:innate immunity activator protein-like isoform X3 n=1 Tax=Pristis pectinata TaxID=685728 RepID=UPI00223CE7C3|nr:innate immunity activator protein-like isoform X3 [Pristis pectinata]